ncbi:hypothetical protein F0185_04735 [Massilia sp. CCM 8692]|uniref:NADH:flavin oxidoreductase/NADH oxidase N-terminal domain-containing protein n=1 Tax=Massilia rubra TaxID=2607910 RepID=A0ABX0LKX4_9BURK|nr:hypothetical protein [Massilia rubra]
MLFDAFSLRATALANRAVMAPATRNRAIGNTPNRAYLAPSGLSWMRRVISTRWVEYSCASAASSLASCARSR